MICLTHEMQKRPSPYNTHEQLHIVHVPSLLSTVFSNGYRNKTELPAVCGFETAN
jgi:hypothetical protein